MEEWDRVSHLHGRDIHHAWSTIHPILGRVRRDGPRREDQQSPSWERDREYPPRSVLHRRCTRSYVDPSIPRPRKSSPLSVYIQPVLVLFGESIASEGIGEHMFVEGRVLTTGGKPIPGAVMETWETDGEGEPAFRCAHVFPPDDGLPCVPKTVRGIRHAIRGTHRTRVPWPTEDRQ
jgi:hypothetical protein